METKNKYVVTFVESSKLINSDLSGIHVRCVEGSDIDDAKMEAMGEVASKLLKNENHTLGIMFLEVKQIISLSPFVTEVVDELDSCGLS